MKDGKRKLNKEKQSLKDEESIMLKCRNERTPIRELQEVQDGQSNERKPVQCTCQCQLGLTCHTVETETEDAKERGDMTIFAF